MHINLSATPLPGDIWAFGLGLNVPLGVRDKTPPDIETDTAQQVYMSPDFDGTQDDLDLPFAITDERYVNAKLNVTDYILAIYSNDASEFGAGRGRDAGAGFLRSGWAAAPTW